MRIDKNECTKITLTESCQKTQKVNTIKYIGKHATDNKPGSA